MPVGYMGWGAASPLTEEEEEALVGVVEEEGKEEEEEYLQDLYFISFF